MSERRILRLIHSEIQFQIDERRHQIRFSRAHRQAEQVIRIRRAIKRVTEKAFAVNGLRRGFDLFFQGC